MARLAWLLLAWLLLLRRFGAGALARLLSGSVAGALARFLV